MSTHAEGSYYVPHGSKWPIVGSVGMITMLASAASWMNGSPTAQMYFWLGLAILIFMMFGWFGTVIRESQAGMYSPQVDRSFRLGMAWFIYSEVMFFGVLFGALLYARMFSVPWLGGEGTGAITNDMLWQGYSAVWPTNGPGDIGGSFGTIPAFGVPFLNTLTLLTSGLTITLAHHALRKSNQTWLVLWLVATVALGSFFLYLQAGEYHEAYTELGLTLGSGIYGATFFMLTGFHGIHVTLGTIMLTVILFRSMKGHFAPDKHFAFEAVAWYWHLRFSS